MREIKFRGQCEASKEMVFGDLVRGVGYKKGNIYILPNQENLAYLKHCDPLDGVKVIPETVGEFTGQQDKNGTDIYERDILVKIKNRNNRVLKNPKVIFEDACYILQSEDHDFKFEFLRYYESETELEVIGNIDQNPDLV